MSVAAPSAPVAVAGEGGVAANRTVITASLMLATIMNTLDTTIANVALPHVQGSISASQDQITWVLTSYIVAAAIMTPLTGWMAGRFGRKRVFMVSIAGFTVASALCGLAQSLPEIVLFRLLQGVFGAALVPLSQAVLLDINPPEKHGQAMALWGAAAILGPIMGPALGGYLTENLSWRWVFYINVPLGMLAFTGVFLFIVDPKGVERRPLDLFGFGLLSLAVGAFQLALDRGPTLDWFSSGEVRVEAAVAVVALFMFAVQTVTARRPFVDRALFTDPNFLTASVFGFAIGLLLFSSMALLPPFMENLLGYPVVTTGLLSMPRGLGSFVAMFAVGQLVGRFDARLIIFVGLCISAVAGWQMTQFNLEMDSGPLLVAGLIQGLGIGLIFVPLSTIAFATLSPALRTEGAAMFTLIRNIGSSAGISILAAMLTHYRQGARSSLIEHVRPDNPALQMAHATGAGWSFDSAAGLAAMVGQVERQAAMVAYVADFRLMLVITLAAMPLLLLMRAPARRAGAQSAAAHAVE